MRQGAFGHFKDLTGMSFQNIRSLPHMRRMKRSALLTAVLVLTASLLGGAAVTGAADTKGAAAAKAGASDLSALNNASTPANKATRLDDDLYAKLSALPPMTGKTLDGTRGKVTLVTFFASWCPPCTDEFHHLNKLRAKIPEADFDIVAINVYEDYFGFVNHKKLARFLKKTAPTFVTLESKDWVIPTFENIDRVPTVFVFDRTGKKVFHFIHIKDSKKMSLTYDELLGAVEPHL